MMVSIKFHEKFADDVKSGNKRQTIRMTTKAHSGCELKLYTGTKGVSFKHLKNAVCISVTRIIMYKTLVQQVGNVAVMGVALLDEFAQRDGFKTYADMWAFFEPKADHNGEFHGCLIRW